MPTPLFLSKITGGEVAGDDSFEIRGANDFANAGRDELAFYDGSDSEKLSGSKAGCIITNLRPAAFKARSLIIVSNVRLSWARALSAFSRIRDEACGSLTFVSPSSSVDSSAVLLPFTYVGPGASIGEGSVIGPNVTILSGTRIGARVKINAGSVIGSEGFGYTKDEEGNHVHIPQLGIVIIEDDVEIGAGVTVDRAAIGETRIGKGTKIDNLVHIAHNVKIGERCIITGQCGIAGSSVLDDEVVLAGQVGVKDHVRIGKGAVVLAKSAVFKDIEPGAVVSGIPARDHRQTLRAQARLLRGESGNKGSSGEKKAQNTTLLSEDAGTKND